MNYTLFALLSSLGPVAIGLFLIAKYETDEDKPILKVMGIILIIVSLIWGLVLSMIYSNIPSYKSSFCMEKIGTVPIEYIWNQNQHGVYIEDESYLLKNYLHDYDNQSKLIVKSWQDSNVVRIDSLEVFKHKFKPWLGFVTSHEEKYTLVLTHDIWVNAGTCRDRVNELMD